jgi:ferric-dicitrate binding protein FerR (iron transport regulator)
MDRSELQRLAKKYLDGTATPGEKELLNEWYENIHDGDAEVVSAESSEAEIKQRIFENIRKSMPVTDRRPEVNAKKPVMQRRLIISISSAAAAILLLLGGLGLLHKRSNVDGYAGSQMVNVIAGKIMKITLPDGSLVWLNAHSVFKYPNHFKGKLREVQLVEGRAFFDVKHEDEHPFVVKTKNMNITVLGTSFDVRTYQKEGTTKVSVITGKVGITRPGHEDEPAVMLLPREQVVLSHITSELKKEPVKETVVNLWCKSPLVFEQENLDNVFKAIEKQYNTHIQVADQSLLNERISITLGNQRLDTIMEILSFTKHFNYQIANDSTVVIK